MRMARSHRGLPSAAGDGSTSDVISVPRHCDDPTVLIQPAANRSVYIASAFGEDEDGGEDD